MARRAVTWHAWRRGERVPERLPSCPLPACESANLVLFGVPSAGNLRTLNLRLQVRKYRMGNHRKYSSLEVWLASLLV